MNHQMGYYISPQSLSNLSRRQFLLWLAGAGAVTVGGTVIYTSAPWLGYDQQVDLTWRPLAAPVKMGAQELASIPEAMHEIIRYATLAANGHNTQPWKFAVKSDA